jgi:hypothetical protein
MAEPAGKAGTGLLLAPGKPAKLATCQSSSEVIGAWKSGLE